jgi:hypothetical protein
MKEGGSVSTSVGNADYLKVQGSYSTGLMDNGFQHLFVKFDYWSDGYVDGTKFEGKNYFYCIWLQTKTTNMIFNSLSLELLNGTTKEVLLIHCIGNILNMVLMEVNI